VISRPVILVLDGDGGIADLLADALPLAAPRALVQRVRSLPAAERRLARDDVALLVTADDPKAEALLARIRELAPRVGVIFMQRAGAPRRMIEGADGVLRTPLDVAELRRVIAPWTRPRGEDASEALIEQLREDIQAGRFRIPVSPAAGERINAFVTLPEIHELVAVLRSDPLLAAWALRSANEASPGLGECRSLVTAVNRLGAERMHALLVRIAAENRAELRHAAVRDAMLVEWRLACLASEFAGDIHYLLRLRGEGTASLAALLGNIGRLLVLHLLDARAPEHLLVPDFIHATVNRLAIEATAEALVALNLSADTRAIVLGPIATPDGLQPREQLVADAARWLARAATGVTPLTPAAILLRSSSARRLGLAERDIAALLAHRRR